MAAERPDAPLSGSDLADPPPIEDAVSSDRRVEAGSEQASLQEATPANISCTIRGFLVDEADNPLADVNVRLAGYPVWADGFEGPRLSEIYDIHGWKVNTDAAGKFRFEVAVPTADQSWLEDRAWTVLHGRAN